MGDTGLGAADRLRPGVGGILVGALALTASVAYGALLYGFSVLLSGEAAGGEFSSTVLSAGFGGAVLTGGLSAWPVGRHADRHGVAGILALGSILGFVGLVGFAASRAAWQVLLLWWVVLGPVTAMTFYEPAYVALQQWFDDVQRTKAIAALTLLGGLSGPVAIPATGALVTALGWRPATVVLGTVFLVTGGVTAGLIRRYAPGRVRATAARAGGVPPQVWRSASLWLLTAAAVVGYGAFEALIIHRVARFTEAGFPVATVSVWAAASGLVSIPGRYVIPALATRLPGATLLAGALALMGLATLPAIPAPQTWQLAAHFLVSGVVLGALLPLRAVVMADWYAGEWFGRLMGIQATLIAVARAGIPALTGLIHDRLGGYTNVMTVLAVLFVLGTILAATSSRARYARPAARAPSRSGTTR
jgi:MFS family permease